METPYYTASLKLPYDVGLHNLGTLHCIECGYPMQRIRDHGIRYICTNDKCRHVR